MIKINLLGDKSGSSFGGHFQIALFIFSVACLGMGFYTATAYISYQSEFVAQQDTLYRAQLSDLKKITKEVRGLEKKREMLKRKIEIIEALKSRKIGPVHVLDDLNIAVPEKSWLLEVRDKGGVLRIDGLALDNQTIADFIKRLEKSEYFIRVDLLEARQEEVRGVKMKRFAVSAKINYGGTTLLGEEVPL